MEDNKIQTVFGWESIDSLVDDVKAGEHSNLLYGSFVFAARQDGYQIIISKRVDIDGAWIIGIQTPTWSGFIPRAPFSYLTDQIVEDMKSFKFNKQIINNFIKILTV